MMAIPGLVEHGFKSGLALLFVGLIMLICGVATPAWSVGDGFGSDQIGLWLNCTAGSCVTYAKTSILFEVCEAFALIGAVNGLLTLIIVLANSCVPYLRRKSYTILPVISLVISSSTVLCVVISVAVWGAGIHKSEDNIGASFIVTVVGSGLLFVGAICVYLRPRDPISEGSNTGQNVKMLKVKIKKTDV